ncbi:DUF6390 family protein [Antrihabitans cavernicola]|uniref:Uncharacterized protein n=1 Tax=Antrihabitans cavernicola TaxID=2495913 RepID=A0A5A7SDB1_9NOCA|nr:DUF6390 family protein [Spelaeibacter cavernicola]KAA0022201.1 hypothetical protein FOY51_14510 [Spelaeibacter cavernicola]
MSLSPGERLFAQYVYAPNALGYCGPDDAHALVTAACGGQVDADLTAIAKRFSGAWPYQRLLANFADVVDPLDSEIVRAYWTGNSITDAIDRHAFGTTLLETFAEQAGAYWRHLTPDLIDEVAPTHAFHVFGVYPWSRLLSSGAPQPLQVLDSCRINVGTVVDVRDDNIVVRMRQLEYDGTLRLGREQDHPVQHRVDAGTFVPDLQVADRVAVHWAFVCDRLTSEQADRLDYWTQWQLERTNRRLTKASG